MAGYTHGNVQEHTTSYNRRSENIVNAKIMEFFGGELIFSVRPHCPCIVAYVFYECAYLPVSKVKSKLN